MAYELEQELLAYKSLGTPQIITPIEIGLINKTYLITTDRLKFIFQELAPIFQKEVNFDSDAVSSYLLKKHIPAPKILKTDQGELFSSHKNHIFRAICYIEGESFNTCLSHMAQSAGLVLGKFHEALLDFEY